MDSMELVQTACPKIGSLGSAFYFHPDTVAKGKELGLDGFRFYFLGRGGVLGDVEPQVIQSAFGYFEPGLIAKIWNSAKETMAPTRPRGRISNAPRISAGRRSLISTGSTTTARRRPRSTTQPTLQGSRSTPASRPKLWPTMWRPGLSN